jgi:hypothetical protein
MSPPHIIGVVALECPPRLVSGCHKLGYPGDGGRPILDELRDDVGRARWTSGWPVVFSKPGEKKSVLVSVTMNGGAHTWMPDGDFLENSLIWMSTNHLVRTQLSQLKAFPTMVSEV